MLVCTSKTSSGRSTVPDFLPAGLRMSTVGIRSDSLGSSAHQDDAAAGAGHGALDQQQALVGIHGVDREVLGGLANATHATSHLHALEDATRGGAGADGTVSYTHLTLPTKRIV